MGERASLVGWWDGLKVPAPLLARLFLGAYFFYTGVVKVVEPSVFLKGVRLYSMLPESPPYFLNATAVVVPWLEIVCGLALFVGLLQRGSAVLMAVMLCVFTPAILLRGLAIMQEQSMSFWTVKFDCGCGTGVEITWIKLCKNLGLLLLVFSTLLTGYRRFALDSMFERPKAAQA
ncbi:MAG: DoxX family membrane protein [Planctomycetes bacterium]|nr:DoxX family membrane protein [Planctomycetota bacterium]